MTRLDDLLALAERATPGPWQHPHLDTENHVSTVYSPIMLCVCDVRLGAMHKTRFTEQNANGDFIAAAREAVPALVRTVRELSEALEHIIQDPGFCRPDFVAAAALARCDEKWGTP